MDVMIIARFEAEPFTIRRGDEVSALIGQAKERAWVLGISNAREMVRITTLKGSTKGWEIDWRFIFPALPPEPMPTSQPTGQRLSAVLRKANAKHEPPGGWTADDAAPREELIPNGCRQTSPL